MNGQQLKLKVILTGATGMVGEGVMHECLQNDAVESVLVINRRSCGVSHPKLKEIVHADFFHLSPVENQLAGYNACFFCLGVSSVGMKEPEYYRMTYTLTMNFAETVLKQNPGISFCYISGASTDSTEKGRMMWARVKGKTENDLLKLGFKQAYNFRPGIIQPTKGLKNTLKLYTYMGWLLPVIKFFSSDSIVSLKQIGMAMINAVTKGYEKKVLEVKDIISLSKQ
ncbi:MAG: NAD-dependent epimerase/dehydratase family protein [Bacteroidetes bacterium]|nr:MAG: NAD-dependent epimerase/dehydratase family protein [Bacteroidota bacterium]